ncbi:hypothetical protein BN7_5209 [Wickerhamomyces ciferrii]|uniref:Uncharacterized protein n=1 Tax=Wickerhamomyces ciferrii (strain ATCC 14091 / BCRC 22168 / CBS 111 / JCM 3599 / NBRC 0793 / NRRL Y-1031 F-60-10) TaxID=1206466 RepID=K0KR46_WICCF|nr:uncharacterized protein BN7_5209 [Wickerhamomyces ciferrii]CCH45626.1 hypothetical protein BN7_5209 [Wickerhamomyces ciferrii]
MGSSSKSNSNESTKLELVINELLKDLKLKNKELEHPSTETTTNEGSDGSKDDTYPLLTLVENLKTELNKTQTNHHDLRKLYQDLVFENNKLKTSKKYAIFKSKQIENSRDYLVKSNKVLIEKQKEEEFEIKRLRTELHQFKHPIRSNLQGNHIFKAVKNYFSQQNDELKDAISGNSPKNDLSVSSSKVKLPKVKPSKSFQTLDQLEKTTRVHWIDVLFLVGFLFFIFIFPMVSSSKV